VFVAVLPPMRGSTKDAKSERAPPNDGLLPYIDLLLYLCFDDASETGAEKVALLTAGLSLASFPSLQRFSASVSIRPTRFQRKIVL